MNITESAVTGFGAATATFRRKMASRRPQRRSPLFAEGFSSPQRCVWHGKWCIMHRASDRRAVQPRPQGFQAAVRHGQGDRFVGIAAHDHLGRSA
jgi:hypothetical protein